MNAYRGKLCNSGSVEKAELHLRPFADIPNPYDHACSVLCNHPHGFKFTWMARRFVHFLQIEKTRARLGIPPSMESPFAFMRKYETSPTSLLRIQGHPRQEMPTQKFFPLSSELAASADGLGPRAGPSGKPSDGTSAATAHEGVGRKKRKVGRTDGVLKKGKKGKLKKKKKKKKLKGKTPGEGEQTVDGDAAGKGRRGLRAASTREEVDDPLTLVEDESEEATAHRRAFRIKQPVTVGVGEVNGDVGTEAEERRPPKDWRRGDNDLTDDDDELDPQKLVELELILQKGMGSRKAKEGRTREVDKLNEELAKRKILKSDSWMNYPRTVRRNACRFELPVNSGTLLTMSPKEYMVKHCVLSDARRHLYRKVFLKHRDRQGQLQPQNMVPALSDVIGSSLEPEVVDFINKLLPWSEEAVPMKLFGVIAALTERLCCGSTFQPSQETNRKDELEYADFELGFLEKYLNGLDLGSNLKELLVWIGSS